MKEELLEKEKKLNFLTEEVNKSYQEIADLQDMVGERNDLIADLRNENHILLNESTEPLHHERITVEDETMNDDVMAKVSEVNAPVSVAGNKCDQCQFTSTSRNGMKIHIGRKHKENIFYPV